MFAQEGWIYLQAHVFICASAARRGTALRGGALLLPTKGKLQCRNCNLQGAEPSCSPGGGDCVEQGHQQGQCCREHQICVTANHTGVLSQAPPAPSTVPPEQENLLGAPPRRELLASQGVFGLPRLPQEKGEGPAPAPSHIPLPSHHSKHCSPPGSQHTLSSTAARGQEPRVTIT